MADLGRTSLSFPSAPGCEPVPSAKFKGGGLQLGSAATARCVDVPRYSPPVAIGYDLRVFWTKRMLPAIDGSECAVRRVSC